MQPVDFQNAPGRRPRPFFSRSVLRRDRVFGERALSLVPMIGASGAIAGVMGAYFVLIPDRVFIIFFIV